MWVQQSDAASVYNNVIALSQMTSMMHDDDRNHKYHNAIRCAHPDVTPVTTITSIRSEIAAFTRQHGRKPLVLDIGMQHASHHITSHHLAQVQARGCLP